MLEKLTEDTDVKEWAEKAREYFHFASTKGFARNVTIFTSLDAVYLEATLRKGALDEDHLTSLSDTVEGWKAQVEGGCLSDVLWDYVKVPVKASREIYAQLLKHEPDETELARKFRYRRASGLEDYANSGFKAKTYFKAVKLLAGYSGEDPKNIIDDPVLFALYNQPRTNLKRKKKHDKQESGYEALRASIPPEKLKEFEGLMREYEDADNHSKPGFARLSIASKIAAMTRQPLEFTVNAIAEKTKQEANPTFQYGGGSSTASEGPYRVNLP